MDDQSVLNEIETWPIGELKDLRKTCATYIAAASVASRRAARTGAPTPTTGGS
jgi:hypothetical protein